MYRLLACVEYNGSNYIGWQKQINNKNSIQEKIEKSISKIANHKIEVFGSSRTDCGVHSLGQIFHFDTKTKRKNKNWLLGSNYFLPKDISLKWIKKVSKDFHCRFNAIARRYIYVVYNNEKKNIKSIFLNNLVLNYPFNININLMLNTAKIFIGKHDFFFLCPLKKRKKINTYRNIIHLNIYRKNSFIFFDIKANSFFYHMIRKIINCLLLVGSKIYSYSYIKNLFLFENKNKDIYINIVKPYGLYLHSIFFK